MSTITGVAPNALHVASPHPNAAQIGIVLRDPEKDAFAPVEEPEAGSRGQNTAGEEPGRQSERRNDLELQTTYSRERSSANRGQAESEPASGPEISTESDQPRTDPAVDSAERRAEPVAERAPASEQPIIQNSSRRESEPAEPERSQEPAEVAASRAGERREQQELQAEQQQIAELRQRDREVRTHEQAHKAVGGQYAGAVSLQYEQGPDGVNYAVAGEVQINLSRSANNPEADLQKAQQVRQAALAPAEPSPQDRAVAAAATQLTLDAQERIRELQQQEAAAEARPADAQDSETKEADAVSASEESAEESARKEEQARAEAAAERTREQLAELLESTREASNRILEIHQIEEHRKALGKLIDFQV